MTLTSQIIVDSLRESNLVPLGESGDPAQGEESLRLLDRLVSSVFGNEVGERLTDWTFPTVTGIVPQWDYIPADTRIVMGPGAGARTFYLNPYPQNGDRLQLLDAGSGFAANNVTLVTAAAKFGGSNSNFVADDDGFDRTWIYRADIADWKQVSPLDPNEEFPFPQAHDDAFIGMLATRLSPRYEKSLSDESRAALDRAVRQLRAAYSRTRIEPTDLAVLRLTGSGMGYNSDYYLGSLM